MASPMHETRREQPLESDVEQPPSTTKMERRDSSFHFHRATHWSLSSLTSMFTSCQLLSIGIILSFLGLLGVFTLVIWAEQQQEMCKPIAIVTLFFGVSAVGFVPALICFYLIHLVGSLFDKEDMHAGCWIRFAFGLNIVFLTMNMLTAATGLDLMIRFVDSEDCGGQSLFNNLAIVFIGGVIASVLTCGIACQCNRL